MRVFHSGHGTFPERMAAYRDALADLAPRYTRVESPERADVVFYTEPGWNKFRAWTKTLLADETISTYPEKCFVYEFSDRPVAFLPGLYVNMPSARLDRRRMRAADYWSTIDSATARHLLERHATPSLLFSFRGFASSTVRRELLALEHDAEVGRLTQTFRWHDYGGAEQDEDRRAYLDELRDSWFVLCPRGLAPSSFRVYEAVQLGRVPVILADDWEPSDGVPWADFSIRLPESKVGELPEVLELRKGDAAEMGQLARDAWARLLQPGPILFERWLRAIERILEERPAGWSEAALHAQWRSHSFRWQNQIHPVQGLIARARRL
jgi:Exostosin family